jgi:type IV pilus biogenesis protein PilP
MSNNRYTHPVGYVLGLVMTLLGAVASPRALAQDAVPTYADLSALQAKIAYLTAQQELEKLKASGAASPQRAAYSSTADTLPNVSSIVGQPGKLVAVVLYADGTVDKSVTTGRTLTNGLKVVSITAAGVRVSGNGRKEFTLPWSGSAPAAPAAPQQQQQTVFSMGPTPGSVAPPPTVSAAN